MQEEANTSGECAAYEERVEITTGTVPDPLADFHGKPLISGANPKATYVGRVIIELWDQPGQPDERNLAIAIDGAPNSDTQALLKRIVNAVPGLLRRLPLTHSS